MCLCHCSFPLERKQKQQKQQPQMDIPNNKAFGRSSSTVYVAIPYINRAWVIVLDMDMYPSI